MPDALTALPLGSVSLLAGLFQHRFELNRRYVMSLKPANVLQNHYGEAALWNPRIHAADMGGAVGEAGIGGYHWGWEAPTTTVAGALSNP